MIDKKQHWENVYSTKNPEEVSWTQTVPKTSLHFIRSYNLPKTAAIIDIGGGDSKLVDYLLADGYENITVLDISAHSLNKAKLRLGEQSKKINWIVSDIESFKPTIKYDIWHDRATFHFLTAASQVATYLDTAKQSVTGYMTIGTFSETGPDKCSGLHVKKYSEEVLVSELKEGFKKIKCITEVHNTPFYTTQDFLFCSFKRSSGN
jgi:hypothetical protein